MKKINSTLTQIMHELSPVAGIVIASRPKAAWRSRLLDCLCLLAMTVTPAPFTSLSAHRVQFVLSNIRR